MGQFLPWTKFSIHRKSANDGGPGLGSDWVFELTCLGKSHINQGIKGETEWPQGTQGTVQGIQDVEPENSVA